jgi:hypothetical protein
MGKTHELNLQGPEAESAREPLHTTLRRGPELLSRHSCGVELDDTEPCSIDMKSISVPLRRSWMVACSGTLPAFETAGH